MSEVSTTVVYKQRLSRPCLLRKTLRYIFAGNKPRYLPGHVRACGVSCVVRVPYDSVRLGPWGGISVKAFFVPLQQYM